MFCPIALFAILGLSCAHVHAQQIQVESKATAGVGWMPWYEIHANPDNENNMILCGSNWDTKDNAFYGFVFSSANAGRTWRLAMADKSSVWVSEESCAYGVRGVAYFVAGASQVIDGNTHHDQGTTRIYVSHDSGRTWKLGVTTGWTDWSTSVVDTTAGQNQNRLYVFFNNLESFYKSVGDKGAMEAESKNSSGSRVGMISYKDGDALVVGPVSSAP